MKNYAWRLAENYQNHQKYMSLRDGVEMEAEGVGSRWAWNVRSVTGIFMAKNGTAGSLREAKQKAEGAADGVRALARNAYERASQAQPIYRMDRDRRTDSTIHEIRKANPDLDDEIIVRIAGLDKGDSMILDLGAGGRTRIERVK